MSKELIINATTSETRVALLEDGTVVEFFMERGNHLNISGNIYKGRVHRVLPGMQAAFVDIGLQQAAFIYVTDVFPESTREYETIFNETDAGEDKAIEEDIESGFPAAVSPADQEQVNIGDIIAEGQEMLVQVAKSPIGSKGARVTTRISLPGRFLVLMPTVDHVGVSKRIVDDQERTRLKDLVMSLRKEGAGFIVRTAAEGIGKDQLEKEMVLLESLWEKIQLKFSRSGAPSLLHRDMTVSLRAVRDYLTHEADRVVVDADDVYKEITTFLNEIMPRMKTSVARYTGKEPIFDAYNIEGDLSRALKKKVWLKSGGYIIIEPTEALVVIDVNTGSYVGKHNFEETVFKTNLEAAREIAYQIRLRNLGGIIIIDFIDMARASNREKVFNALKEFLAKDKNKSSVLPFSELGLIQMTRKRTHNSVSRMLCEPCLYCDGDGYLLSQKTICYNIYREILRESSDITGEKLTVKVHPDIAELLHGEENEVINALETELRRQIIIYPMPKFHIEQFEIEEIL
ncbi:MAG: Rne/Rng family ribonuclease [Thermodesulfobacteriota bacterium]|nr:Rne/Rng family ribonuclease [Thermodesulfobacteriota bacterium]